jgi:Fur family ferric uptake transcriptional regulator
LADAGHSHEQQVETILQKIVDRGGRRTMSRQAVIRVIVDSHGHVTADDIATEVKKDFPSVDVSTVYRTLETLRDIDIVDRVYFADGSTVYHLKDHQHHHLCCESCGAVQELPITLLESVESSLFNEFGFRVTQRPLGFFGLCAECAKA